MNEYDDSREREDAAFGNPADAGEPERNRPGDHCSCGYPIAGITPRPRVCPSCGRTLDEQETR